MANSTGGNDPLELYDELVLAGKAPDKEAFANRYPQHPDLLDEIEALEALRVQLDEAARRLGERDLPIPSSLGDFRLLELIGRGGMGVVYLGVDHSSGRRCAVKLLRSRAAIALQRFHREAEVMAELRHPGIAQLYRFGIDNGQPYIASELVPGSSLGKLIDETEPPLAADVPPLLEIILQAADTLAWAHEKGVVHRDVKPSNMILQPNGALKLIDFGVALNPQRDNPRITHTGIFVGSHNYAAPEQLRGDKASIGPWSDVYGLGASLFELLAGRTPFQFATLAARVGHAHAKPPHGPRHFNKEIPRSLDRLIRRALAPKARKRFPHAGAFAVALRQVLDGLSLSSS